MNAGWYHTPAGNYFWSGSCWLAHENGHEIALICSSCDTPWRSLGNVCGSCRKSETCVRRTGNESIILDRDDSVSTAGKWSLPVRVLFYFSALVLLFGIIPTVIMKFEGYGFEFPAIDESFGKFLDFVILFAFLNLFNPLAIVVTFFLTSFDRFFKTRLVVTWAGLAAIPASLLTGYPAWLFGNQLFVVLLVGILIVFLLLVILFNLGGF